MQICEDRERSERSPGLGIHNLRFHIVDKSWKIYADFLYLLDRLIFANIVQSHDDNDDNDDVCMHTFVRRFIAFFRSSNGADIQKS